MEHDETGCQPSLDGPILCVNNCGFFGSPANMNMCSKCYKAALLKQEAKAAVSTSIDNIVNGPKPEPAALKEILAKPGPSLGGEDDPKPVEGKKTTEGPNRCGSCGKRVGLTGFKCRCGGFFCGTHRYSEEHGCPFDYQAAGKDAIAKANPVVKAEKLDKI